ncbi:anti-sigma factor family protein [Desmospora activa]|uniref:Anti-sigma-W factor RsiW n=1 Tax=Desmospora activa DSM 45169 TaxID=1121389 RepID=A0A2T4ZDK7_9BACL|nr:zf-HC2 domain-containing protein [Desmospora activa]PTM59965.1 putative zinc finger protein [Desmospora activa DSM 45169]
MSCKDMDRLIQLYLDQEIEETDLQRLWEHVQTCDSCRQSLREMIALVQTLEGIRSKREDSRIVRMNQLVKWMAVATSIVFIIVFSPPLQSHYQSESDIAGRSPEPIATHAAEELPVESAEMMVLATGSESLPIPENDYIRVIRPRDDEEGLEDDELQADTAWIYPSALPFVLQNQIDWHEQLKRLVFIGVPDSDTLHTLLAAVGFSPSIQEELEEPSFPTSVILTTGQNPQLETFTFPEKESSISHWFEKMATTPAIP